MNKLIDKIEEIFFYLENNSLTKDGALIGIRNRIDEFKKQPSTAPVDGGMRWVKGKPKLTGDKRRFIVKHKGNVNVVYFYMGVWYFDDYESMRVFDNDWEDIYWLDESPLPVQQQPTPKQEVQDELKNDWHPLSKLSNQPVQPIVGYTREQVEKAMHDTWNQVYYSMTHPDVTEPKEEFSFVADYLSTLPTPSNSK